MKTFIWRTLSAVVRSRSQIVTNVLSSGIAALLLLGGRTSHSRFGLPIIVHEISSCSIKQQSPESELLSRANLIIWEKTPMMRTYYCEALERSMRAILDSELPFGGKVVVLGGDFQQILHVVFKKSRQDIVHATINSSPLWMNCKVLKLHKNMRRQSCFSSSNVDEVRDFAEWILKIGDGEARESNDGDAAIENPDDMLIRDSQDPFLELLQVVYPIFLSNKFNSGFFQGRAILAPTNESIEFVSNYLLSMIHEEEKVYFSSYSMCKDELTSEEILEICSTQFLNTIKCYGLPSHKLKIKVGVHVMLIRNIDQARGLCNGTQLQVTNMGGYVLHCKIISGKRVGDIVFIPRMTLVPSNSSFPVKLQRCQFSVIVSFAMKINKSQGLDTFACWIVPSQVCVQSRTLIRRTLKSAVSKGDKDFHQVGIESYD